MHWKESIATVIAITHIYDGWSEYPMNPEICGKKRKTNAINSKDVKPTEIKMVEYTRSGFSLDYLKNVVSMP